MVPNGALVLTLLAGLLPAAGVRADPLFESRDFLQIRLTGPLQSLSRDRDSDPHYRPATLAYTASDGHRVEIAVKLRPRGNSRRDHYVCAFPPLRVNLPEKQVQGTLFEGQNKLKLVTHCRPSQRYAAYVYKEYLAYRMLNQVTDVSFRVRGLEIVWIDSDRGGRTESHFGFFIEDKRRLAKRLHLNPVEPDRVDPATLEPDHTSLVELFQYMIGNTDFSFIAPAEGEHCCHNAVLMANADAHYLPVPYDFDISGLVDPPYAVVDGGLPIASVRDRLFRGFCRPADVERRAVARFREAEPAIVAVVNTETPLAGRARRVAQDYVTSFFSMLKDPDRLERRILAVCRG